REPEQGASAPASREPEQSASASTSDTLEFPVLKHHVASRPSHADTAYQKLRLGMTLEDLETAIGIQAGDYDTEFMRFGIAGGPCGDKLCSKGLDWSSLPDAS